jgi:hypothetical protein
MKHCEGIQGRRVLRNRKVDAIHILDQALKVIVVESRPTTPCLLKIHASSRKWRISAGLLVYPDKLDAVPFTLQPAFLALVAW